jgi:hypothetical protein
MGWLRLHTSTLDCGKVQRLSDRLFRAWVNLMCLSRIHGGTLPDLDEIGFRLRCTERQAAEVISSLEKSRLIDRNDDGMLRMHDWDEHQYVSDNSTERVRKHRMKRPRNVSETPPEAETEAETEQKQNQSKFPPLPCASEYPLTLAAIREHDPAADPIFAARLVQETIQHCLSSREFPQDLLVRLTDSTIARCVEESYRTKPNGHGTGLLLRRVPNIAVTGFVHASTR